MNPLQQKELCMELTTRDRLSPSFAIIIIKKGGNILSDESKYVLRFSICQNVILVTFFFDAVIKVAYTWREFIWGY